MIASTIRTRLLAQSALVALVGTRITVLKFAEHSKWPAARVQQIGEIEELHLRGSAGLLQARVQIDYAASEGGADDPYAAAEAAARAGHGTFVAGVPTGLLGFRGQVGAIVITGVRPLDRREQYDPDDRRIVMVSRDYLVSWKG